MKGFILRADSTLYGLNSFITFIMIPDTMLYKAKAFDTFNPFDFPLLHYFIFNFLTPQEIAPPTSKWTCILLEFNN